MLTASTHPQGIPTPLVQHVLSLKAVLPVPQGYMFTCTERERESERERGKERERNHFIQSYAASAKYINVIP